jgi:hypothetical protein
MTPQSRLDISCEATAGRHIVLFGGAPAILSPTTKYLADTWSWNGNNWTAISPGTSPGGRAFFGIASDPESGPVFIYGGQKPTNPVTSEALADSWGFGRSSRE